MSLVVCSVQSIALWLCVSILGKMVRLRSGAISVKLRKCPGDAILPDAVEVTPTDRLWSLDNWVNLQSICEDRCFE